MVHSPFVYKFVYYLRKHKTGKALKIIKKLRNQAKQNRNKIFIKDEGKGGKTISTTIRKRTMVSSSTIKTIHAIYQTICYFKPVIVIETGTNLGYTTIAMALANPKSKVYSIEADKTLIEKASKNIFYSQVNNIELIHGTFEEKLPQILKKTGHFDLTFVDGNHKYEPTIQYFHLLLQHATSNSIIIFDDICWSPGMKKAWKEIIEHPSISVSINFGYFGMAFFKQGLSKQNFVLRI
jgi:predicted O-methyltransferase YrrM